jgi:prepilin peptidase CpaA
LAAMLIVAATGTCARGRSRTAQCRNRADRNPFWIFSGLSFWPDIVKQIGVAMIVFLLFAIAFRFGAMGGGDVKMVAALALWLPAGAVLKLLVIMSLAGGVLTMVMLLRHRAAKNEAELEIPYGVAIAFGGFWLIGERFLNQFG